MSDSDSISTIISSPAAEERWMTEATQVSVLVEDARLTQSQQTISADDRAFKRSIRMAATTMEGWAKVSSYDPKWLCTPLTKDGDTALHIAVRMENIKFVKKLVKHITNPKHIEIQRHDGNTAFCLAAISGNVKIATILCEKNPKLLWIKGHQQNLPIQLASSAGQLHMVKFLFEKIQQDTQINLPFQDIVKLFFLTLTNNIFTATRSMLDQNSELAHKENENGLTALQLLAQSSLEENAPGYKDLVEYLFMKIEEEEDEILQCIKASKAMFDAAQLGNILILESIFNYNPNIFLEVNCKGQSLLHIAILHRQEHVYDLVLSKEGSYKNTLVQLVDDEGNNVLHLVGQFGYGSPPLHEDLIRNEELWFKKVEKIVPPTYKTMENKNGKTPKEIFYMEHKQLSEKALIEMNGTANTFIVVVTLLMTLGISGALSIRNNKINENTHFLKYKKWFEMFILSLGIGVSLCAISLLLLNSIILPSIWTKKRGYVDSRLTRLTLGYLSLYSSFFVMVIISIYSGVSLVFSFFPNWFFHATSVVYVVPLVVYLFLFYYPLYIYVRVKLPLCQQRSTRVFCPK